MPARLATALALAALAAALAAGPADAYRSPKGAKPSVKVLNKDMRSVLKTNRLLLRLRVGTTARVRLRVLGLDLSPRPVYAASERKIRFRRATVRKLRVKLTKFARGAMLLAQSGCRNVRVTAFASARQYGRRDSPRTTLVRHSKTLGHGRGDCRTSGVPGAGGAGLPGAAGAPPGLGGPGLEPPGTPPGGGGEPPPVPTDPIAIRAGAADGDATPPVGTPMFAYTARSNIAGPSPDRPLQILADPDENLYAKTFVPSQGIHTRIRARAIVIEAGGKKYALVQVDLGGHPFSFTQEVLKRIASTGIAGDRLLLSSTHTHSSSGAIWSADNSGYAALGGDFYDPRVFDAVVSGVVDAILTANQRLQPARVGVGTATLRGASRNRSHDPFKRNPDATADEKAESSAAIDPRVTVVRVDAANGAPLGAWSNFAVHPTSFGDDNLLFSGDNAATTERLVEEEMLRDAAGRGIVATQRPVNAWTNGTEGDVSPNGDPAVDATEPGTIGGNPNPHRALEHSVNSFGGANSAGRKVSTGILDAWRDAGFAMSGSPVVDVRHTFMALDGTEADGEPVGPAPVLGYGGVIGPGNPDPFPTGGCAPADDFAGPGQGSKFPAFIGPASVPNTHPVSLLRIGPLAIAAFPSEITTIAGRRIKARVAAAAGAAAPRGAVIAGLTNSYNSYTATPEEYGYCDYEGSFTLWGRRQSSRYRDLAEALAKSLYGGAPAPAPAAEPAQVSPGTPQPPSVRPTPDAGSTVAEPAAAVSRLGQAVFRWNGGDPAIDAPRGKAFVTLEYEGPSGFRPVSTEDSVLDATRHASDDSWTEAWQFTECDALGRYRFVVRGVANKGSGTPAAYTVTSRPFELRRAGIDVYSKTVSGGVARVRAEYRGLPGDALALLARRVRHGFAILRVHAPGGAVSEVVALPDAKRLEFTASVPAGSTVDVVSVEDACGNAGS